MMGAVRCRRCVGAALLSFLVAWSGAVGPAQAAPGPLPARRQPPIAGAPPAAPAAGHGPLGGAAPAPAALNAPQPSTAKADAAALAALLDPSVARAMAEGHVPGAALVVVEGGAVAYSKGYGLADPARGEPVSPASTSFHAMSVSKVVTAAAIMQLAAQGRLDLHADVNRYLRGVRIPSTYPQPVTLDQLLTHTAGFDGDQEDIGTVAPAPAAVPTLDQYLTTHPPARLQPPGQRYRYSNADYDVLGAVIERVTGQPFDQYMDEHVLGPLGMARSSFRQRADAPSFAFAGGAYRPLPAHYFGNTPSRGLSAPADDMARLLAALLPAASGGPRLLGDAALADMLAQHFTYRAGEPGMAYGFQEYVDPAHGLRVLWKDGRDDVENNCMLVLLPDRRAGWFVAVDADDGERLAHTVYAALLAHYAGQAAAPAAQPAAPAAPLAAGRADAARVAGTYRDTNYSHRTLSKLLLLSGGDGPQFQTAADGALLVRWGGEPATALAETAPLLFSTAAPQPNGISRYLFLTDARGRVDGLAIGAETYERVPWYATARVQAALFAAFLLVFLLAALSWPAGALRRRARPGRKAPRAAPLLRALPALVGALDLFFLAGLFGALRRPYALGLEFGAPAWLIGLLLLPQLAAAGTLALALLAGLAWRDPAWSRRARAGTLAFTALALAFLPFLAFWNLLGFRW